MNFKVFLAVCSSSFAEGIAYLMIFLHSFINSLFYSLKLKIIWKPTLNFSLIKSEDPMIAILPSDIIPIDCDSSSASSKWWVVNIKHRSALFTDFIIFHIPCLDLGSNPDDGSSRKMILDFPIKAFARETFLLFPPDKFLTNFPFYVPRAHSIIVSSTFWAIFSSGTPFKMA